MSFIATQNKGFRMTFDNKFTISVQWGTINYCEKKNLMAEYKDEIKEPIWESKSAEIAVFERHSMGERMLSISSDGVDDVIGWLGTDDVAKVIAIVSSAGSVGEIQSKVKKLGL